MDDWRVGKFQISAILMETDFEAVRLAMSGMVVLRAERMWCGDYTDYVAWCEDFDVIKEGEEAPVYVATLNKNTLADGSVVTLIDGWERKP